jgi:hypothetical protein
VPEGLRCKDGQGKQLSRVGGMLQHVLQLSIALGKAGVHELLLVGNAASLSGWLGVGQILTRNALQSWAAVSAGPSRLPACRRRPPGGGSVK